MKQWLRRLGAVCAVFVLLCPMLSLVGVTAETDTDWKAEGYTPIGTAADLHTLIRKNLDGKFYLTNNIVFKASDFEAKGTYYNDGSLWLPIGPTYSERFTGVFDGNGYTISGLKVAVSVGESDSAYAGLFGYSSGKIRNVRLLNCSVQIKNCTYGYAGGIVGAAAGTLSNCYVLGGSVAVSSAGVTSSAGGVVGRMYAGSITECYSSATVNSSGTMATAGGIAAQSNATINVSMNQGNITAKSPKGDTYAGGIVGIHDGSLANALNKGAVSVESGSDAYAGGIVGANRAAIQQSVNIGAVKASAKSHLFGGAVAGQSEGGTLSTCYYLNTTYDKAVTDSAQKATALSSSQMGDSNRFSGLNFDTIWTLSKGMPMLRAMSDVQLVLTGIKITQQPTKKNFIEGQKLDTTGMVVTAYYEDGTTKALSASDYVITGYDNLTTGRKTLTVSYGGYTATFTVTVAQKVLTGIQITPPNRVVFGLNEELDLTGGLVKAQYDNGSTINYTMTNDMVSGYDNTKLGKQTLTVTFYGKKATFDITMQKDPPPTTATTTGATVATGAVPTGSGVLDNADDSLDDDSDGEIERATTGKAGDTSAKPSASIWIALVLVLVCVLAAAGVFLFGMKKQGKLVLHADARHGKKTLLDPATMEDSDAATVERTTDAVKKTSAEDTVEDVDAPPEDANSKDT